MSEIILCTQCNGKGKWPREELVDYHQGLYEVTGITTCYTCKGSGRLLEVITRTPYEQKEE